MKHYDKSNWKKVRLGDIVDIFSGGTPKTSTPEYWNGDILWCTPTDITANEDKYISDTEQKISALGLQNSATRLLPENTLLLCSRATIGAVKIATKPICTNQGFKNLVCKDVMDTDFLYYYIPKLKPQMIFLASGSTFLEISKKQLAGIEFTIPTTKSEQVYIANVLSKIDSAITNLQKLISKQESIKKTTLKLLLTPKPHWTEYKIKEKFKVTRGLVLSTNQMSKSQNGVFQYPVYSSQTQNNGLIGFYNNFLYQDAITWTTDGANAGFVRFRPGKFYCTNVCGVLLSDEGYANTCVATMLGNVSKKYVSYVGNPKLMNNVMAEIPLLFPSVQEQQYISDKIQKLDQQLEHLRSELDKYRSIKNGLMDYFFG